MLEFHPNLEILLKSYHLLTKKFPVKLIPVPYPVQDSFSVSFDYKQNPDYFSFKSSEELVTFGEYDLVRDVGSQTININPVKFDAALNKIKVYSKIVFKVNFSSSGSYIFKTCG